jgi:Leucine-rich repeat (LRR) protein
MKMITATYSDYTRMEYKTIEEIKDPENVVELNCYYCNLTKLPENMNFPNLKYFDISYNELRSLPNFYFPKLIYFSCSGNHIESLPEFKFPKLQRFNVSNNNIKSIPKEFDFPKLKEFDISNNYITLLPKINSPNLKNLDCCHNCITTLPEELNFPNLEILLLNYNKIQFFSNKVNLPILTQLNLTFNEIKELSDMNLPKLKFLELGRNKLKSLPKLNIPNIIIFEVSSNELESLPDMNYQYLEELIIADNKIKELPNEMILPNLVMFRLYNNEITKFPLYILNFRNLRQIIYEDNPIELSPQIARFIQRIKNGTIKNLNVYNDSQNVHNSTIQSSVKDSINNITTRTDLPKFDKDELVKMIIKDDILSEECKNQLIEYSTDKSEHSLLLLTFGEVLWHVLQTIENDFKEDIKKEIKTILNQEMKDAECKCFTGRMNRVVNCLNGFSKLVCINIQDSEQIGNIIFIIKDKLEKENNYSIEKHKELVIKELVERGYDKETINQWIEYIE